MPITNAGIEYILKNINGVADTEFVYIATGSGSTAFSVLDTALASENTLYGSARKTATCSFISPATARWNALFNFTGDVDVREYGLFDASDRLMYRHVMSSTEDYHDGGSLECTIDLGLRRV